MKCSFCHDGDSEPIPGVKKCPFCGAEIVHPMTWEERKKMDEEESKKIREEISKLLGSE